MDLSAFATSGIKRHSELVQFYMSPDKRGASLCEVKDWRKET